MTATRIPHREYCGLCGKVVTVGFHVPDDIWELVVHKSQLQAIHCLECFTRRADEQMVEWDREITFYPISLKSHLRAINLLKQ